ncbi:L,D-transpeptidase [uncultured Clostridium sp.]|uniref:L,D-transpeptidase n=1 Tax=uncultured Clostridium sp. TaxID=59620 RepID=UPI0026004A1E|nr:L,D-transpeptidase [uncultured Clostridium sp.]
MGYKKITKQKRQKKRRIRVLTVLALTTIVTAAICFKYIVLDEKILTSKIALNEDVEVVNTISDFSYISDQKKEAEMNAGDKFDFTSKYGIAVSIDKQKVYVYENNKLIKSMICSTGVEGSDTPLGKYKIITRAEWFFSPQYQEGGKYYLQFMGDFLFHSVPCDRNKNVIPEEENKLGFKASHGCIRLSMDDSKWLYYTVPNQTDVVIY